MNYGIVEEVERVIDIFYKRMHFICMEGSPNNQTVPEGPYGGVSMPRKIFYVTAGAAYIIFGLGCCCGSLYKTAAELISGAKNNNNVPTVLKKDGDQK